jgi:subtilisin-like proprotein convertase family protein
MERRLRAPFLAFSGVLIAAATASAAASQAALSKAEPALLRALDSRQPQIRVIVGLKDGTASARALRERPDPAGEPDRRTQRLFAQNRVAAEIAGSDFRSPRFYESFSMLAGMATPAGVEALARRSDVAWIMLDHERRLSQASASQAPQSLIRSDAANALGFTGKGQTVAILDSGVDQSIPQLGGGSFPNAKVIGGTNVSEPNAAPSDCEGHGTSVASIVASPSGVAPDAKIVAIKVFPGCEQFTFDSLIISGIDFAITNQAAFGISAMNMSLGESATGDDSTLGFCDGIAPQFAQPIDAASAAGIVVTVASGNAATSNQISSPACVSSAVSVGAVYPLPQPSADWGICSDVAVVPGTPTCFSNSNTNLTLLAPGAFWNVPTVGGQIVSFSGTSAAAPAVAGSVALVRQARPNLSVSTTVSLLRATGRPITDQRNGVVTPLIDDLAAVQFAPSTFGNLDNAPIPIPDGTGSATATTTVSGFTGYLESVQVWVEIDHAAPGQLRLTLTGPDGTSVILHDRTGQAERPINAIFGGTEASLFPLSAFQGGPANGTWTLTVQDLVAGVGGSILHFSVTPIAGPPQPPVESIPLAANGLVFPIVARTQGTKFFQTDTSIYNPTALSQEYDLYFVGTASTGATALKTTGNIGPGQVLELKDIVLSQFGQQDSIGQVTVLSNSATFPFLGASHVYTQSPAGTFGFAAQAPRTTSGLTPGSGTATTNGLAKTPTMHTNVGFTETSGFPVTVRIDVRDNNGTLLGSTSRTTQPYTTYLITDILLDRGIPSTTNFRVDFTVVSPQGRAIPFATTVDKITGDSVFHAPLMPALTADDYIVTQSSHLAGANGDFFQTALDITNMDTKAVTVTVSLIPLILPPGVPTSKNYFILPGQTLEFPDVLSTQFDLDDPVAAGLRIHPASGTRLAVSSRTSVAKFGGTFGYSVDGVRASTALAPGGFQTTFMLDQSSAAVDSRSNFGFVEVGGHDVMVLVTAVSGDTGAAIGGNSYFVAANTGFQASVQDVLGAGVAASNFYLQYQVVGGTGRIVPYANAINNMSGDGSYIPGQ